MRAIVSIAAALLGCAQLAPSPVSRVVAQSAVAPPAPHLGRKATALPDWHPSTPPTIRAEAERLIDEATAYAIDPGSNPPTIDRLTELVAAMNLAVGRMNDSPTRERVLVARERVQALHGFLRTLR